jgi:L-Ala-D/L-Glu epimerase
MCSRSVPSRASRVPAVHVSTRRIVLEKRHALTISRGTMAGSENLVITVEHDGVVGMGELAPGGEAHWTDAGEAAALRWQLILGPVAPSEVQRVEHLLDGDPAPAPARAALDMAMWDWIGRRAALPLWQLWGLDRARIPVTSVTVGINPVDVVARVSADIAERLRPKAVKVKLGSPDGPDHDRAILTTAQHVFADRGVTAMWRVDANGGWSPAIAEVMIPWLAERDVDYVEQPYAPVHDAHLGALRGWSPLPIYVDESVRTSADVVRLASSVHGINLKLMKTGGLTEALRLIHTARACQLGVMIGCMGETSLAITAGAHLSPLVDHVDLDSQLNLRRDPYIGAAYEDGRVVPGDGAGLGVMERGDDE